MRILNSLKRVFSVVEATKCCFVRQSWIFCMAALVCLSSCTWQHKQDEEAQERRICIAQCEVQMKHCQKACKDNCQQCEKKAVRRTRENHERYLRERCIEGKSFILRLQSYHDPLECRKMTCNCAADLRVCVESCRGRIHKQIQVEKSCC